MTLREWLETERNGFYGKMVISAVIAGVLFLASWLWADDKALDAVLQAFGYVFVTSALIELGAGGAIGSVRKRLDQKEIKANDARL
jgi:hypothetical protein